MTYLVGLPILALAAVVQSTVLSHLHLFGGALDLVLLVALSWTIAGDWQGGVMWGFMGGLGLDLLSGGPLGAAALGMVMMTYFASLTEGRFWRSHVLLPLATVLLGTVGFHAIYLLGLSFAGHPISLGEALWRVTLPSALLNAVFMLPVYNVLRWLRAFIFPAPVAF